MQEDFIKPRSVSKPIPTSELKAEERTKLQSLGLTLEEHEAVASDILERIEQSSLDADTVNKLALEELDDEDDLSTLHPDVAQSIRDAASSGMFESKPVENIMEELDEDGADGGKVPAPDTATTQSTPPAKTAEEVDQVLRSLLDKRYRNRQTYRAKITEDDRNAILEEVISGKRFTKVFKFFGGRITLTLGTISAKQSEEISTYLSKVVNETPMSVDHYNAYRNKVKAAARIVTVTANNKIVYNCSQNSSIEEIMDSVFQKVGNSELFRSFLAEGDREMNGILEALLEDASHEVFTVPAFGDIG